MTQPLIDLALLSEKRKDLLLLLKEGPKNIDEIKESLSVNAASIQPHIKRMKNANLIIEKNRSYRLSEIGEIIVENMQHLLSTLGVLEEHIDYWVSHDLSPIPDFLLDRIEELGRYEILEPNAEHMFETPDLFLENIKSSKKICTFVSYFHPESPELYASLVEKYAELTLCMTEIVAERLFKDFPQEAGKLAGMENSKLLICRKPVKLPSIVVTDRFMTLKLMENDGKLRDQILLCFEEEALRWGKELFTHYMEISEPLDEKELMSKTSG
ncbi:Transcriptional regulator, ArsR family [Methanosarcina sp. MTP4]|uniref:helix-turn-helix transcriptional regulator n=1 Tax=Methanosarcina sp. MTP4 TaxID=1434100 RepID=UPI0006156CA6|nr:winged helix-turn-helix domain-containing protein [Methanosarcina sp. MTP4]AKB24869.1 Transcriptional regulator, ArsR family [Methanosarcina sp. MTP4]